ncbi:MAG: hypothetical protein CMA72_07525 [Euryarchaeota archaeon]|jgi:hypothetical protein|nr:hypothetical protein [Euryarchaeota archaeon]|tara:strand:- start:983 stop:1162 length:180 start_codon:yes stop_codon:yes gene_type:complete
MIEVGSIVKSKYHLERKRARMGVVIKVTGENEELAQVYYPHRRDTGWVKSEDMEVVSCK